MRFNRLDLITYGKFKGDVLALPRSERDFHLLVGANEAGKSTARNGIKELLFGMPMRTSMDFRYPKQDLALGAEIHSHDGSVLEFIRDRSRASLKSPAGAALAPDALLPFLGSTTDKFFIKVFCLDLESLIAGGKTILDASDEVGQLLFQSAAGISSLGAVRGALEAEADKLFSPNKSDKRAVYQALNEFAAAKASLKDIMVNTRTWKSASDDVGRLQGLLNDLDDARRLRLTDSSRLQRIRRLASLVATLHHSQDRLAELGEGPAFADDAADVLATGIQAVAVGNGSLGLLQNRVGQIEAAFSKLVSDDAVLALRTNIEQVARDAEEAVTQRRDLESCRRDVDTDLKLLATTAAQIGWPSDEAALRTHVPVPLTLKTVTTLIASRGAIEQKSSSDAESKDNAKRTLQHLRDRRAEPSVQPVSQAFEDALRNGQALGQAKARIQTLKREVNDATIERDAAFAALGAWRMDAEVLAAMSLPSIDRINGFRTKRSVLDAALNAAKSRSAEAASAHATAELRCSQFEAGHNVVLLDDVLGARAERDTAWAAIKTKTITVDAGASHVDLAIARADSLVDTQRDTAALSATFQSLKNELELRKNELDTAREAQESAQRDLDDYEAKWVSGANAAGLDGIDLDDMPVWLARRDAALTADATLAAKTSALQSESVNETDAVDALVVELSKVDIDIGPEVSLESALASAVRYRQAAEAAAAARQQLDDQIKDAEADVEAWQGRAEASQKDYESWKERWRNALAAARLDASIATEDAASGVVDVANEVLTYLADIARVRSTRIEKMEGALESFDAKVTDACAVLDFRFEDNDSVEVARRLKSRLDTALRIQADMQRQQKDLNDAQADMQVAEAALHQAKAGLGPIYAIGGTEDEVALRLLISNSAERRELMNTINATRTKIVEGSDGLGLEAVEAEVADTPVASAEARLTELDAAGEAENPQRTELTAQLVVAKQRLAAIAGGSAAAVAESKKNEAMALMTESAERYIKVASAAKVLSWVIERYRERKQGPMLSRAGELFSQLTVGQYDRLIADFDGDSPRLTALRGTEKVGVEALSDGTRDQLFLALRLAALEMHIDKNRPLPFVADDLLVNYDEKRVEAGLRTLAELSRKTQVIFLTHHEHMVPIAKRVLGDGLNVVTLQ